MGNAYTPGLKVVKRALVRKERRLPLKGEVLVSLGEKVESDTAAARTHLPGNVELVNVANHLGIDPKAVRKYLLKKEGEHVSKGELIAKNPGLFGLFKSEFLSPVSGFVETISEATGKITLRQEPVPLEMKAYVSGIVEEVIPGEGVVIKTYGTYIHGIFGIGGETWGVLQSAVDKPDEILDEKALDSSFLGKILFGGSLITLKALQKAVQLGIKGIIIGGIEDQDLRDFLGYDLGVAVTGGENKGITIILTEGFGRISMAEKTFRLLKESEGRQVAINGTTQIRAGVIRPEVIISYLEEGIGEKGTTFVGMISEKSRDEGISGKEHDAHESMMLQEGSSVRIIRDPYFGQTAKIAALPSDPQTIQTEAKVRVAEVILKDGTHWVLPRGNLELIQK
jgi:hypothetical protein